ncbi:NadS family protein [Phreatobacter sp.]|uniref:NadS family protein n=1 Tax=Phreatobacter sp. TaxID=1966341 RepID=UPI0025E34BE2|nr:NadS family protein [Phreatobacter sp.]
MAKLGSRLVQSAREAHAIARGDAAPARVFAAEEIDVAAIRKRLNLSQDRFAKRFGLSPATVRDWEQKRRRPDRIATNLLRVIDHAPETVERALAAEQGT